MFDHSILKTAGQWRLAVGSLITLIAGAAMLVVGVSQLWSETSDSDNGLLLLACGTVLGFLGMLFALAGVRCPQCKAKWIWIAMKEHSVNGWLAWLVNQKVCPKCGR